MKRTVFMALMACVASFAFTGCGSDDDEPDVKNNKTKVTVKYNFIQSFDLHNAVDVEMTYYDLESGKIATDVLPAELKDGEFTTTIGDNDTLVCAFYLTFKNKEGFVAETSSTYDLQLDYSVDVIVEQPGKDARMWSEEGMPFQYLGVEAENMGHMVELIKETDDVAAGCVVKKVDDTFYIYDKSNNMGELFK